MIDPDLLEVFNALPARVQDRVLARDPAAEQRLAAEWARRLHGVPNRATRRAGARRDRIKR